MADITIRAPHQRDIGELAARMRAADVRELHACNHFDLLRAVEHSVRGARQCWATLVAGELLCIGGVNPLRPHLLFEDVGVPWLLGTESLVKHRRTLITHSPVYIARMLALYPRLLNYVHADNHRSIRWLRHMGFQLSAAAPFGPNGAPFHRFEKQRHV